MPRIPLINIYPKLLLRITRQTGTVPEQYKNSTGTVQKQYKNRTGTVQKQHQNSASVEDAVRNCFLRKRPAWPANAVWSCHKKIPDHEIFMPHDQGFLKMPFRWNAQTFARLTLHSPPEFLKGIPGILFARSRDPRSSSRCRSLSPTRRTAGLQSQRHARGMCRPPSARS